MYLILIIADFLIVGGVQIEGVDYVLKDQFQMYYQELHITYPVHYEQNKVEDHSNLHYIHIFVNNKI
jgi:hypothetical protein